MANRKFLVEFEVTEANLQAWIEAVKADFYETEPADTPFEWNAIDILGSDWMGEGPHVVFNKVAEIKLIEPQDADKILGKVNELLYEFMEKADFDLAPYYVEAIRALTSGLPS